jgi:hypothetical protein
MHSLFVAIDLGKAGRHELDKFRERLAVVEAEFHSTLSREKAFSGPLSRAQVSQSRLCARAFGGVTQDLLARASATPSFH